MTLTQVKNAAHQAVAILGAIAASAAVLTTLAAQVGIAHPDVLAAGITGAAGALASLLSMLIDSRSYTAIQIAQAAQGVVAAVPGGTTAEQALLVFLEGHLGSVEQRYSDLVDSLLRSVAPSAVPPATPPPGWVLAPDAPAPAPPPQ